MSATREPEYDPVGAVVPTGIEATRSWTGDDQDHDFWRWRSAASSAIPTVRKGGKQVRRSNFLCSVQLSVVWVGFLVLARTGFSEPPPGGESAAGVLTVQVVGARNAKGKFRVALFQE